MTGPEDFPPSDVPAIAFDGYAGGLEFPADLETCPKRESPNFINVEGAYSGVPDVKVTCTNKDTGETEADRWLSISKDTKDERVCDDCFAQSGYASFIGGFTYSGTVGLTVGSRTLMGQCLVTGSFRTSGCDTNVQCVP